MSAYVILTAMVFQRGSAESKDPDAENEVDQDPELDQNTTSAPLPVKAGGLFLWLYSYSLGIALTALFVVSFALHFFNSLAVAAEDAIQHGEAVPTPWEHLISAQLARGLIPFLASNSRPQLDPSGPGSPEPLGAERLRHRK